VSLLLDALKRAEEAKRGKAPSASPDDAVREEIKPPVASGVEALALEDYDQVPSQIARVESPEPAPALIDFSKDMPDAGAAGLPVRPRSRPDLPAAAPTTRLVRQDFSLKSPAAGQPDENAQRETARNVFAAKKIVDQPSRAKWLLPLVALLVVGIGAGAWYTWNEIARVSAGRPQLVAVKPPSAGAVPTAGSPAAPAGSLPAAKAEIVEVPAAQPLPPLLPPPATRAVLPKSAVTTSAAVTGRVFADREVLARSLKSASPALPKEAPVSLKLSQTINPSPINPDLVAAYAALGSGDYAQSRQRYERVVQAEPFNLDAHLGLAVTYARSGENGLAARHYRRVLELDPRNADAVAGLLSVSGSANSQVLEVELKTLISRDPNAASLQFSLGNLYAGERRWSEAQQAYFEAYRLDSENADYRYNLAVALDQMKQYKLALEYYQKALVQLAKSGGQFERAAVQRRIAELNVP
jgi:tetratricopeptide (TPR) repeat protein